MNNILWFAAGAMFGGLVGVTALVLLMGGDE